MVNKSRICKFFRSGSLEKAMSVMQCFGVLKWCHKQDAPCEKQPCTSLRELIYYSGLEKEYLTWEWRTRNHHQSLTNLICPWKLISCTFDTRCYLRFIKSDLKYIPHSVNTKQHIFINNGDSLLLFHWRSFSEELTSKKGSECWKRGYWNSLVKEPCKNFGKEYFKQK